MKPKDTKNIQIINKDGKPEFAVLLYKDYEAMLEKMEDYEDQLAIESFERDSEKSYPSEVIECLVDGQNPFKVWRKYRNVSRQNLASAVNITLPYLSQLEGGKRRPSVDLLMAISQMLNVDMELLLFGEGTEH
jgi:DNA-binding XRE family transcriptional regulator